MRGNRDGHKTHIFSAQGVQVKRQGRGKGFAFTRLHFRDFALVQYDATDELDIKRDHVPCQFVVADFTGCAAEAAAGILHGCEGLGKNGIKRFAFGDTLLEFVRLRF